MANHHGRNHWLPCDGLRQPDIGRLVILRRLVTHNGETVARYLTDPDLRADDHVTAGPYTSIYDGQRAIVDVRRNKNGSATAVRIDAF